MAKKNCEVCNEEFNDYGVGLSVCADCRGHIEFEEAPVAGEELKVPSEELKRIKLTTGFNFTNFDIDDEIGIVTAECVFGMNIFRDFFASARDFFGGRSDASQKVLRDLKDTCLLELKKEAYHLEADGVIAVHLDYQEISGGGKGMLFLVASGTAVKFK